MSGIELYLWIFLVCLFLHCIADYIVQTPFIAKYKQIENWKKECSSDPYINTYFGKYKHDYIVVLLVHSFTWSVITFYPIYHYLNLSVIVFFIFIILNTGIHMIIDDLKANKFKINLIVDQVFHLIQIVITLIISVIIYNI